MRTKEALQTVTATSPAAASTVIHTVLFTADICRADRLVIDAALLGATGGTLDIYLQRNVATNVWVDWVHFPQLAAGAVAIKYTLTVTGDNTAIVVTGQSTDASITAALAVNTSTNTIPTGPVRIVFVAGASTSAGAAQTIRITPFTNRT